MEIMPFQKLIKGYICNIDFATNKYFYFMFHLYKPPIICIPYDWYLRGDNSIEDIMIGYEAFSRIIPYNNIGKSSQLVPHMI